MNKYSLWINGCYFCGYFESREKAERMVDLMIKTTRIDFYDIFEKNN